MHFSAVGSKIGDSLKISVLRRKKKTGAIQNKQVLTTWISLFYLAVLLTRLVLSDLYYLHKLFICMPAAKTPISSARLKSVQPLKKLSKP